MKLTYLAYQLTWDSKKTKRERAAAVCKIWLRFCA
jgi:hypothetical protein